VEEKLKSTGETTFITEKELRFNDKEFYCTLAGIKTIELYSLICSEKQ